MSTSRIDFDSPHQGSARIALINVRVFDGRQLLPPDTVVIESGVIGIDPAGAETIDGDGATLLPGLIDAHVHLLGEHHLAALADFGVTTALDMAAWPPSLVDSLRNRPGLTDIRSAGIPATSAGSAHSCLPGYPHEGLVNSADEAEQFVADRVAEGVDYIKLVADVPGPDQATLNALAESSRRMGKATVAHAVSTVAYDMAVRAGVNVLTHAPLDSPLDESAVQRMLEQKCVVVPTLTMMKGIYDRVMAAMGMPDGVPPDGPNYDAARQSVGALHRAGVPILAGTDANDGVGVPFSPPHGESLHGELELLVEAGLTNVEALLAATALPAKHFGLNDRGVIEPGRRADLVLIGGDPTVNIAATRQIQRVWCAGIEHGVRAATASQA
ncbi:amidohydrolase family protein [Mycobacterium intracellulare]|uniref:amidohydrolase family protein n=1 Tax=Mycobacterium intracellulare TaxID=1767 RepID=UPI001CDB188C|nr:amidohydrolase family protein [Mycobacterium intracellulare]MCA2255998.1 amidohydrolase family protein [Mycobacterium intracellulare]